MQITSFVESQNCRQPYASITIGTPVGCGKCAATSTDAIVGKHTLHVSIYLVISVGSMSGHRRPGQTETPHGPSLLGLSMLMHEPTTSPGVHHHLIFRKPPSASRPLPFSTPSPCDSRASAVWLTAAPLATPVCWSLAQASCDLVFRVAD